MSAPKWEYQTFRMNNVCDKIETVLPGDGVYYLSLIDAHDTGSALHVYRLIVKRCVGYAGSVAYGSQLCSYDPAAMKCSSCTAPRYQ